MNWQQGNKYFIICFFAYNKLYLIVYTVIKEFQMNE